MIGIPGRPARRSGPSAETADGALIRRTRRRLVLWSGGVTLVILLALGVAIGLTVARSLAASGESLLRERASILHGVVAGRPFPGGGRGPGDIGFSFGGPGSGTLALLVDADDRVVGPSEGLVDGLPDDAGIKAARAGSTDIREVRVADIPVRVLSEAVQRNGDTYVIQVVADRTAEERLLRTVLLVLGTGGLVALALSIVGGFLYAERALAPIRSSLRRQRDFAADASHELRTPLAVVRTSVDHLMRHPDAPVGTVGTALDDIRAETDRIAGLAEDLLLLARADSGAVEFDRTTVDLADVATDTLSGLEPVARARGVHLALDAVPATVDGDPSRLRQVLTILTDNAIRHGPDGGTVTIRVATGDRRATVAVDDDGPGIRAEDRERLFERFWRAADAPAGGSGLGLAIAAWIVGAHDGRISASNRPEGGARFLVDLPAVVA